MSKSLVKLIDSSLLPASLLVVGKLISVFIAISIFNVDWSINEYNNSLFSVRPTVPSGDIGIVSTTSDIIVFIIMVIGFCIQLFYALYLHDTHIPPKLLASLADKNLINLIKGSFEIFHNAAIWNIFLWVTQLTIIVNGVLSKTSVNVVIATTIITFILTLVFLKDVYREIKVEEKHFGKRHAFT